MIYGRPCATGVSIRREPQPYHIDQRRLRATFGLRGFDRATAPYANFIRGRIARPLPALGTAGGIGAAVVAMFMLYGHAPSNGPPERGRRPCARVWSAGCSR